MTARLTNAALALLLTVAAAAEPVRLSAQAPVLTAEQRQAMDATISAKAPARPERPRRLLIVTLQMRNGAPTQGPSSSMLPAQNYALEQMMLEHVLAGIQYALGDLPPDDRPSGQVPR